MCAKPSMPRLTDIPGCTRRDMVRTGRTPVAVSRATLPTVSASFLNQSGMPADPGDRDVRAPDAVAEHGESNRQIGVDIGEVGRVEGADGDGTDDDGKQRDPATLDHRKRPDQRQERHRHCQHVRVQIAVEECEEWEFRDLIAGTRRDDATWIPIPFAPTKRERSRRRSPAPPLLPSRSVAARCQRRR